MNYTYYIRRHKLKFEQLVMRHLQKYRTGNEVQNILL